VATLENMVSLQRMSLFGKQILASPKEKRDMHAQVTPHSDERLDSHEEAARESTRPIRALNRGLDVLTELNRLERAAINTLAAAVALPFAAHSLGAALTPLGAVSLLYLGIVQLGVAYLLFAKGLRRVPASEASLVSMLEPVFNPLWVFLGTGERPGPWALLGGAIVIGAVVARTLWREPSAGVGAAAENPVRGPETTSR